MCSVSLTKNGELIGYKEVNNGFTHAENLHLFISEMLKNAKLEPMQLSAVAVSKGPGSYTGLRIGVSSAKGLCYALNIPLLSVDTLQLMAYQAYQLKKEKAFYCAMLDARRMEVYTCLYNPELNHQNPAEALIVDETSILKFARFNKIYFFGDGMPKCRSILSKLSNAHFIEDIVPSAKLMGDLAFKKYKANSVEDVAYFEPFYLKDFMIMKKKESL